MSSAAGFTLNTGVVDTPPRPSSTVLLLRDGADGLEVLMQRRDTQIQYLYERELEFQRIAQSPTYRLARLLAWPLRKVRAILSGMNPLA